MQQNTRLFISGLPQQMKHPELRVLFSKAGTIVDLYMPPQKPGIAFIEMKTKEQAAQAINILNNSVQRGKKLRINYAKERNTSTASGQRQPRRIKESSITDTSLFIKKAAPVTEKPPYIPTNTFKNMHLDRQIVQNIEHIGYKTPTPIQDQVIPLVMQGKDVIGIANTGTGKTAAFLLPLLHQLLQDRRGHVLIITPTRELASQIEEQFRIFARYTGLYSTLCIGGANINPQIQQLKRRPSVVIGTPGRIKDLIESGHLYLEQFNHVVLDEVDRMLDMGFIEDITYIIKCLPKKRQSLFFSATLSSQLRPVAQSFLTNPITISVKEQETSENIDQDVIRYGSKNKIDVLHDLLIQSHFQKVLIFGRTKQGVEKLSHELVKRGFKVNAIHGNKTQSRRQQALKQFKQNNITILVATDVAARGLDIHDITHVINYDLPQTYEDYVHRIGRTGRANKKGQALTFVQE